MSSVEFGIASLCCMPKLAKDEGPHGRLLAELAALKAMSVNELMEKWEALSQKPAQNNARNFMELRIGYGIQELAYGGLTLETRRALDSLAVEVDGKITRKLMTADPRNPILGTKLIRKWEGV